MPTGVEFRLVVLTRRYSWWEVFGLPLTHHRGIVMAEEKKVVTKKAPAKKKEMPLDLNSLNKMAREFNKVKKPEAKK